MIFIRSFIALWMLLVPLGASAHAFGQSYSLPLPVWLYLYGGGAAIIISFLVIGFFTSRKEHSLAHAVYDISRMGVGSLLKNKFFLSVIKLLSLALFAAVLLAAQKGSAVPANNFASLFIWIIFYLGFTYLVALFGNFWSVVNPYKILTALWNYAPLIKYPHWLGYFPALIFYYFFIWGELLSGGAWADPHNLFLILVTYFSIALIGIAVIGREAWFQFCDFFSVFFRLISKIALFEYREGKMYARAPFVGLLKGGADHFSLIIFILFMLSSTAFDGFRETTTWTSLHQFFVARDFRFSEGGWLIVSSITLALSPLIFLAFYWLAIHAMKLTLRSGQSAVMLSRRFAFSLIPIALAYNFAHYFTLLLVQGQTAIALVSDPFAKGWDIFHTANFIPNIGIIGATTVWNVQVAAILIGHIASVYLAHRIALHEFPSRNQAIISQVPMLFVMVLYTIFGLWILSQPMSVGV